jgi:4-hydroxy-2-oxoheptanedioate aldolase
MNGKQLKAALHGGRRVYGTAIISTSPRWPAMIAGTGLDFVFIDTEHIPIDRIELCSMCQVYSALGLAPIVRIPAPDPYQACMALDAGAQGVVAPYMETLKEVNDLRGAVKLRPLKGQRLAGVLAGTETMEDELAQVVASRNADKLMIVNIESVPALNALDKILAVPDIDALLVGPHDLSFNLGVPEQWEHPKFQKAIETIITKARAAHVGVGIHYSWGVEMEIAWAKKGANLIVHASDVVLAENAIKADLARFKGEMGDAVTTRGGEEEGVII